jgi:solute carrier family 35 protein F5
LLLFSHRYNIFKIASRDKLGASAGERSCLDSDNDSDGYESDCSLDSSGLKIEETPPVVYSTKDMFMISLTFCLFWFCANYFYNAGLGYTLVSSSTVLANTSILFVLIFSCVFLRDEPMSIFKLIGVLISFAGATIVTLSEKNDEHEKAKNRILGDIFTVLSAMFYGIYATFLKKKIPEEAEKHFEMSTFLGFVGLINVVILLPLFPIFHFTGIETFELPNSRTLLFLSLNAFVGT